MTGHLRHALWLFVRQPLFTLTAADAKRFLLSPRVLALRWDYYVRRALAARPALRDELAAL